MLSRQKAEEIAEKFPYNTVIGADTVVALGNEIMGKPENEQDAFNMLKKAVRQNTYGTYGSMRNFSR